MVTHIFLVSMLAFGSGASVHIDHSGAPLVNFTTFRLTPLGDKGIKNMDTADAAGDVMFGLNQLLLPQLCAKDPEFLWCENRAYLSGGNAKMVYTEFTVTTRDAFGEYQPCNPCQGQKPANASRHSDVTYCPPGKPNGTFVCTSYGGSSVPAPPQCKGGYDLWVQDCLNGTIYRTLDNLDPKQAEAICCSACSNDQDTCAGWNMPDGYNSTVCQLMQEPLIMWEHGQSLSSCKSAKVVNDPCWYDDPEYNSTFAGLCDASKCHCEIIEDFKPVGRELSAMCHRDQATPPAQSSIGSMSKPRVSNLTHGPYSHDPNYWTCSYAVQQLCFNSYYPARDCMQCTQANAKSLIAAGCTVEFEEHICSATDYKGCEYAFKKTGCGYTANSGECMECAMNHTAELEAANCTEFFVDYFCESHRGGGSWESYVGELACLLNGTWYSTNEAGECQDNKLTPDCWWYIAETKRTVNATCVDGNVVKSVQAKRPDCWTQCPDNQGSNISSACFLHCLFETMLGNHSASIEPMSAVEIYTPFVKSFASDDPKKGGCPDVQ